MRHAVRQLADTIAGMRGRLSTPQALANFSRLAGSFSTDSPDTYPAARPYRRHPARVLTTNRVYTRMWLTEVTGQHARLVRERTVSTP